VLAPDSYEVNRGDDRGELLAEMEARQTRILADLWAARVDGLPYETPQEALIMASIIEKETGIAEERRRVASVFVNRLRQGMRLQTDPTVIYGVTKGIGVLGRGLRQSELRRETPSQVRVEPKLRSSIVVAPGCAEEDVVDESGVMKSDHSFGRSLTVEHKLAGVEQSPEEVFHPTTQPVVGIGVTREMLLGDHDFGWGGEPAQCRQIQFLNHLWGRLARFEHRIDTPVIPTEAVFDLTRVRQQQHLRQGGRGTPFALTNAHPFRAIERIEKVRTKPFMWQVHRAGRRTHVAERRARAAGQIDRIVQDLSGQAACIDTGEVLGVCHVTSGRFRGKLIHL
jgi:hypothetical protein